MIFLIILAALICLYFMYNAPYIIGVVVAMLVISVFTMNSNESSPHMGQRISAPKTNNHTSKKSKNNDITPNHTSMK